MHKEWFCKNFILMLLSYIQIIGLSTENKTRLKLVICMKIGNENRKLDNIYPFQYQPT